jgi:hypothetical protein
MSDPKKKVAAGLLGLILNLADPDPDYVEQGSDWINDVRREEIESEASYNSALDNRRNTEQTERLKDD